MALPIHVLNGPNLNLLGVREPELYGRESLGDAEALCRAEAGALGLELVFRQSNHEGELVDWVQAARTAACALVLNPAGYGYTSVALLDALKTLTIPVVECHLSNIARREPFRRTTLTGEASSGVIAGFGIRSYALAVRAAAGLIGAG